VKTTRGTGVGGGVLVGAEVFVTVGGALVGVVVEAEVADGTAVGGAVVLVRMVVASPEDALTVSATAASIVA
jgi:hypothetical protein